MNYEKKKVKDKKIKVCFVMSAAYPLFNPKSKTTFGGAEVQLSFLAKELAKNKEFDVFFVVNELRGWQFEKRNNIKIYNSYNFLEKEKKELKKEDDINGRPHYKTGKKNFKRPFEKIRKNLKKVKLVRKTYDILLNCSRKIYNKVLDTLHLNESNTFFEILKKVDADIYVQICSSWMTYVLALFCKRNNKKFIFMTAHEVDCDFRCIKHLDIYEKILYLYGLKNAHLVITQNKEHQQLLKKNFRVDSIVKRIMYNISKINKSNKKFILWISRLDVWKQAEVFIELAKNFPNKDFLMIAPQGNSSEYYNKIMKLKSQAKNLKYIPHVHFKDIDSYFKRAMVFVNTSTYEGFPNTFVEAWRNGVPVISLNVDPDEIICKHKLGFHSKNVDNMKSHLFNLLNNGGIYSEISKNSYNYVKKNHNIQLIIKDYVNLFKRLMN